MFFGCKRRKLTSSSEFLGFERGEVLWGFIGSVCYAVGFWFIFSFIRVEIVIVKNIRN